MKQSIRKILALVLVLAICVPIIGMEASAADYPANPVTKEGYTLDF